MFSKSKISTTLIAVFASIAIVMILSQHFLNAACGSYPTINSKTASTLFYAGSDAGKITTDYDRHEYTDGNLLFTITQITTNPAYAADPNDYIFQKSILSIIKNEMENGDISVGDYFWFEFPSCWEGDDQTGEITTCLSTYCCKARYKIGQVEDPPLSGNYVLAITEQTLYSDIVNCDPLGIGDCQYVCAAVNFIDDDPFPINYDLPGCHQCSGGWWNFVDYSFNNGTAQVNYYEFDCPYRQIEVFMEMIWATDPNYDLGNDSEAIYKEATRKVLKKAAANNPGDIDTIAITIQDCWELLSDNTAMVPCDVDACCSATYHVTYDNLTDSYFADYQGMSGGSTNCTSPCENVCDTDYLWNDGQTALKQAFLDRYTEGLFDKFEIMPNPSKGSVKVNITGKEKGNLTLSIYDINGNEVYKSGFNKSSENVIYNLDLSSLSDGMYYIGVEINGKFEIKNKFMIIK